MLTKACAVIDSRTRLKAGTTKNIFSFIEQMSNKTISILKNIGVIAFLVIFPHFVPLRFYAYAIICFLAVWLLLRSEGKTFRSIGLDKSRLTAKAIFVGLASALLWVIFMQVVYIPVIKYLFIVPDYMEYNFIRGDLSKLFMTIIAAWLIGGFYEEVIFRGYIQNILNERIFGGFAAYRSIFATSILFGLYHWQQDIFGVVAAFLGGLFWGLLYRRFGNNLWVSILSHALFDTITLVLIYTDSFGKLFPIHQ